MPELPEVETIRRMLSKGTSEYPSILSCKIINVQLFWEKTLAKPSIEQFTTDIENQKIVDINRRGKYLVFKLTRGFLLIHLKMSGDIKIVPENSLMEKHERVAIYLDNGWKFIFIDPRKFGRVWLVSDPEKILSNLGFEPMDEELTGTKFWEELSRHKRSIKPLLMDQGFVAGLGNIYTDEALYLASIHPLTRSDSISLHQAELLLHFIRKVLKDGIEQNGSSIDWVYRGGNFQNYFNVYRRTGEPCKKCGTLITRIIVGQRSTHLCPQCQPYPQT